MCPVCGGGLVVIGSRKRRLIESDEVTHTLIIRRLRCKACRATHSELPDIVIPYKRHCAATIEKIISGDSAETVCEESTIRRIRSWWSSCRLYFESVMASLRAKFGLIFPSNPAPREIVRAVVNAHLWIHTRSAFLSG